MNHLTCRALLAEGRAILKESEEVSPNLETSLLLAHALNVSRERIYASFDEVVSNSAVRTYRRLIRERNRGIPVAWLIGTREFYGLDFEVGRGILVPRPETETLVERAVALLQKKQKSKLLDLCCGSGCIGIALTRLIPGTTLTAVDISGRARHFFIRNNKKHLNGNGHFIKSNLFKRISGQFDVIVSNPPYLTKAETKERVQRGWKEPKIALGAGTNGFEIIDRIIADAPEHLRSGGTLLIECAPWQCEKIEKSLKNTGFIETKIHKDLSGNERVVEGTTIR